MSATTWVDELEKRISFAKAVGSGEAKDERAIMLATDARRLLRAVREDPRMASARLLARAAVYAALATKPRKEGEWPRERLVAEAAAIVAELEAHQ